MNTARSADGTQIAYEVSGTGPAVVLIDAASGYRDFNSLRPLADLLAKEGFTAYTYDRRGRGLSTDTQPYAVEREIEDLAAVIEAAGGEVMIYGWSSGALLAIRAAGSGLPITKVGLFEPPMGADTGKEADAEVFAQLKSLIAAGRRGEAVDLFHITIGVPPEIIEQMEPTKPLLEAIAHTYPYDWEIAMTTTFDHVKAVPHATLVMDSAATGEEMNSGVEQVVKSLPNGVHRRFEAGWHGVPPEQMAPVLAEFYRK
jgi:pimeloyl-ACP methyl ester carboxylesterase